MTTLGWFFRRLLHASSVRKVRGIPRISIAQRDSDVRNRHLDYPNSIEEYLNESVPELLDNAAAFSDEKTDLEGLDPYTSGVYLEGSKPLRKPENSPKFGTNPVETSVILFPGEDDNFDGMGKGLLDFPNVKEIFTTASEILDFDLEGYCVEGPKSKVDQVTYSQVASLVMSLAALEKLRDERPSAVNDCRAAAGYDVGEFAALVFAGAISFEDAVKVVKVRADAMQSASDSVAGGMAAVNINAATELISACKAAEKYCEMHLVGKPQCRIAGYLHPNCRLVAGNIQALKFLKINKDHFKIPNVKLLPVSGAYHTNLMSPAEADFSDAMKSIEIQPPLISVPLNVDGRAYSKPASIRKCLTKQIVKPILWEQTLHVLYKRNEGVPFPRTYILGPGQYLRRTLQFVNSKAANMAVDVPVYS